MLFYNHLNHLEQLYFMAAPAPKMLLDIGEASTMIQISKYFTQLTAKGFPIFHPKGHFQVPFIPSIGQVLVFSTSCFTRRWPLGPWDPGTLGPWEVPGE